jgi:hypothetical protein
MTRKTWIIAAAATAVLVLPALGIDPAFAQPQAAGATAGGIGGVAKSITDNLKLIPSMLGTIFQAVGIWYAGKSAFALKEMAEDGRDQGLTKKALMYGVAGVIMVALPMTMGVGMNTLFGKTEGNLTTTNGAISIN